MVDLMIALFHLKLDKLYCIGIINQLKIISCDLFSGQKRFKISFVYTKISFVHVKKNYYWFNRQESLQKANDRYHNCGGEEKAGEDDFENKELLKEKSNNKYRNLSDKEKVAKREYGQNRYKNMKKIEKTS